jgi:hypothetical protein
MRTARLEKLSIKTKSSFAQTQHPAQTRAAGTQGRHAEAYQMMLHRNKSLSRRPD